MASAACHGFASSVFEDAKAWWKFDDGGEDGAVVLKSEIRDARDGVSTGVPTAVRGQDGGPTWTNVNVRLAHRRATVSCTALDFNVQTNWSSSGVAQCWNDSLTFNDVACRTDSVTFFARICPHARKGTVVSDYCLINNIFTWGSSKEAAYGHFTGYHWSGSEFQPSTYVGRTYLTFTNLTLPVETWSEVAWSVTLEGDKYKVMCVVCNETGISFETQYADFVRTGAITGTGSVIGGQNSNTTWQNKSNNPYQFKNFHGLLHEMALWERGMELDEILDVFGRPSAARKGDVYADAAYWWKFDRDIDGDGVASADEIRDVRFWGTDGAAADGNPAVTSITTANPPKFASGAVDRPARGEYGVQGTYLSLDPEWRELEDGSRQVRAANMTFGNSALAGSLTVVSRFRFTQELADGQGERFLLSNAHKYGTSRNGGGQMFGFISKGGSATVAYPRLFCGQRYVSANSIELSKDTWYDIAYTFSPGTDAEGTSRIGVAVYDRAQGFRTWSGTIVTNQFLMTGRSVHIGGQATDTDWVTYRNASGGDVSGGMYGKMFPGDIQHIAVWNRVLSTDEIAEAFGYPQGVFAVGTEDGAGGEFAPAGTGGFDVDAANTAWHDVAGTLDRSHRTLTLRFTPPPAWDGVGGFVLRAAVADVGGDGTAVLSLSVNGERLLDRRAVAAGSEALWYVRKGLVGAGENVAVLTLADGSSATFDKIAMSGSWAVVSGSNGNFSQEGTPSSAPMQQDFYVGDRYMPHVVRAVTGDAKYTNYRMHFHLPDCIAANYETRLTFGIVNCNTSAKFSMEVNGESIGSWNSAELKGKTQDTVFAPGTLVGGWNTIEAKSTASWTQFDKFLFRVRNNNQGLTVILR